MKLPNVLHIGTPVPAEVKTCPLVPADVDPITVVETPYITPPCVKFDAWPVPPFDTGRVPVTIPFVKSIAPVAISPVAMVASVILLDVTVPVAMSVPVIVASNI